MEDLLIFYKNLFKSFKILEICSKNNDLQDFMDRETRLNILKEGSNSSPQMILKAIVNIIMDDILGNSLPKCKFPPQADCNVRTITSSTIKVLTFYGIKDIESLFPYIEAAIVKLMENNDKNVATQNENIVVEFLNSPPLSSPPIISRQVPIRNVNPRSLLRKNQALRRRYN